MASSGDMDVDTKADSASKPVVPVSIKHQGKKYDIDVDTSEPGAIFKYQIYSLTGVQPEYQKILIKGRQVKDDTDIGTLGLKPGQAIMVLGQPGPEPVRFQAPAEKTRFVEDMSGVEAARQEILATPGGLTNLGNTCYMNASLQAMRSIPELQDVLVNQFDGEKSGAQASLAQQLREVFFRLSSSHTAFTPHRFLNTLRTFNPRFAERSRSGQGYAQQDAEEAWTFIMENLRRTVFVKESEEAKAILGASPTSSSAATETPASTSTAAVGASTGDNSSYNVLSRYMMGEMQKITVCDEPEGRSEGQEKPARDNFWMLECHISISVNHLRDGLLASMSEKVEKHSDLLGRNASFTTSIKIARLPKYLPVHFVRFFWKRDIQKKAKIMRKVSFPHELDISEMCTEELRAKLVPVREKVREVRKEIEEIERSNKKRKRRPSDEKKAGGGTGGADRAVEETPGGETTADGEDTIHKTDAQLEAEKLTSLHRAKEELYQLVKPQLEQDPYSNHTGLYQLRAVVAHQGAGADSGHYTAFVKKGTILNPKNGKMAEEDGNWWWFNDDSVSEVSSDRIDALAGGGESHSALILLYGSVPLPLPENRSASRFSQA